MGGHELVSDPDQLSQRPDAHLSHHIAAMHLHRRLAEPQFRRNLLVEAADHDQISTVRSRGVSVSKSARNRARVLTSSRRARSFAIASRIASSKS